MPFTTDPFRIRRQLSRPVPAAGGTRLYDAGLRGVELIRRAGLPGGFLVLMTDGTDHGSTTTSRALSVAAREAHVRVLFGRPPVERLRLRGPAPARRVHWRCILRGLVTGGAGADLQRSRGRAVQRVHSAAPVPRWSGGAGRRPGVCRGVRHRVDLLHEPASRNYVPWPRRERRRMELDARDRPRSGGDGRLAWALPVCPLVAPAVHSPRARGPVRGAATRKRHIAVLDRAANRGCRAEAVPGGMVGRLRNGARRRRDSPVARAGGPRCCRGWIRGLPCCSSRRRACRRGPAAVVLRALALRLIVNVRADRQRRKFEEQLADHLAVVGGAMRAGHGLPAALASVLDDAPQPARREFGRVVADERLGAPLEDAVEALARRMETVTSNRSPCLHGCIERRRGRSGDARPRRGDVRERHELRGTVRTLTAQGRMSRWILSACRGDPGRRDRNQRRIRRSALQHRIGNVLLVVPASWSSADRS